jgi:hypothetical protein
LRSAIGIAAFVDADAANAEQVSTHYGLTGANAMSRNRPFDAFAFARPSIMLAIAAFCLIVTSSLASMQRGAVAAAPPPEAAPAAPVTAAPAATPFTAPTAAAGEQTAPPATPTPFTGRRLAALSIVAQHVAFYSNRFIVGADGDVAVTLGDGTKITGNTFSMDLRLNRFVIAGNVTLTAGATVVHGAAFSEFLDFDRGYFLPLIEEPDRWTYTQGDYAHPLLGRVMPGDAFFLPNLAGERVFLDAKRAVVDPHESVRFTPVSINFGPTFVHFPSYFLDFSKNPNFAQNSLAGADIDGPYDFAGGPHGLATAHVRYDSINQLYFSYEQHQISDNHYLVFSVNPVTRPGKDYNLIAYDRISPVLQVEGIFQEFAFQHSFTQPLSASAFASIQLTLALRESFLQLTTNSYYESLLGQPKGIGRDLYYGDYSHLWIPDHPDGATLTWDGFRHKIHGLPLSFQLRSSIGVNHNGISTLNQNSGLQTLGGVEYDTEYNHGVGATLLSNPIVLLKDSSGLRRDVYLTATFDKQRTWYSVPHHIDITTTNISLTKTITPRHLTALLSYTNTNTADFYGAQQSDVYPSNAAVSPATGELYPQYAAFRGFSTSRSFREQLVFTPSPALNSSISLRENDDFPVAVPGISMTTGNVTFFNNFGVPPEQLTLDSRFRINSILTLDVSRSYFFNFGGYQRWSPNFSIQVVK